MSTNVNGKMWPYLSCQIHTYRNYIFQIHKNISLYLYFLQGWKIHKVLCTKHSNNLHESINQPFLNHCYVTFDQTMLHVDHLYENDVDFGMKPPSFQKMF